MKIEWAPIHVPPKRRLQTLAAGIYVATFLALPFVSVLIIAIALIWLNPIWKAFSLSYIAYLCYDQSQRNSKLDGNGWLFFRTNALMRCFRDYFPVELVKTVELKPNRNYIIAAFPHGVIGTGLTINMGLDINKWLQLFPGIRPKISTLKLHFYTPILREVLRLWGLVPVSKESLMYYLKKSNDPKDPNNLDGFTSNAVAILVGGAEEAIDSHPGKYILTLKNRKGFVKLAIKTGAPIVPSFSFGEVDIFHQVNNPPNSLLRRFQSITKTLTGISPLIVTGRGFFQYTFGLLPLRKPIVQVVGAPIEVKQNKVLDPKYIDEIHTKFINELTKLFETHKWKYLEKPEETKLVIK